MEFEIEEIFWTLAVGCFVYFLYRFVKICTSDKTDLTKTNRPTKLEDLTDEDCLYEEKKDESTDPNESGSSEKINFNFQIGEKDLNGVISGRVKCLEVQCSMEIHFSIDEENVPEEKLVDHYKIWFNYFGNPIKAAVEDPPGSLLVGTWKYNQQGIVSSLKIIRPNGGYRENGTYFAPSSIRKYDNKGREIEFNLYDDKRVLLQQDTHEYQDSPSRKEIIYKSLSFQQGEEKCQANDKIVTWLDENERIKEIATFPFWRGEYRGPYERQEYHYDKDFLIQIKTFKNANAYSPFPDFIEPDERGEILTSEKKFDVHGRLVESRRYNAPKAFSLKGNWKHRIFYDQKGQMVEESVETDKEKKNYHYQYLQYDMKGNWTKRLEIIQVRGKEKFPANKQSDQKWTETTTASSVEELQKDYDQIIDQLSQPVIDCDFHLKTVRRITYF